MSEPPITREQIREVTAAWWLPPRAVLESVADRETSWLVVVAARGRGAVRTALFGSVAVPLATTAGRPVVMVPELMEAR
jgi:hypothetical protein